MTRARFAATLAGTALLAASPALASGGGGGGGGGGQSCAPLTMLVKLAHSDGTGDSAIGVQATIRDCDSLPEAMRLAVSVPGSATVPFAFTTGPAMLSPGRSLTMNASPIGSTPLALHFGQTYDVVGTLTSGTGATLATVTTPVTMPPGIVG